MAELLHTRSGILIPRGDLEELTEAMATVFRIGARLTPRMIDWLDRIDGDADLEDATDLEDDFSIYTRDLPLGPGCPIADAGGQCDEDEFNTGLEARWESRVGCSISDPDEEDDHSGGNVTDEPHDPDGDFDTAEPIRGGGSGDYPGGGAA